MITIYSEKDFNEEFINSIKQKEELWDYPFEELDYLINEKENQSFIIIDNRIKELNIL